MPTVTSLINAGHTIKAIVCRWEPATSRNSRELEIASFAKTHNIPMLMPKKLPEIVSHLREYKADIGVLVAYGNMVPQEIMNLFPHGIVNIHPSLLPLHRGPTPIESVIISGEAITGVSVMQLAKDMDAGPIWGFSEFTVPKHTTKQALANNLLEIGAHLVTELLPVIVDGSISAAPQDENSATYDRLIQKSDGVIDWSKPAIKLEREVRAFAKWPKSRTQLGNINVSLIEVKVSEKSFGASGTVHIDNKHLYISCSEGSLEIIRIQPDGKAAMDTSSFLSGYGSRII